MFLAIAIAAPAALTVGSAMFAAASVVGEVKKELFLARCARNAQVRKGLSDPELNQRAKAAADAAAYGLTTISVGSGLELLCTRGEAARIRQLAEDRDEQGLTALLHHIARLQGERARKANMAGQ